VTWSLLVVALLANPEVALVADRVGAVERREADGSAWDEAALEEALRLLDDVRTGARSTAELRFVDRTLLAIGEKTRLRISLALFDVRRAPEEIRVALLAGHIDVAVHASARPLRVDGVEGEPARLAPGQRARCRLENGHVVVEPLPDGFVFASEQDDFWWIEDAGGLAPGELAPGFGPPGMPAALDAPGQLDPLDRSGAEPATGVDVRLVPEP
jgi:hypothetical protein